MKKDQKLPGNKSIFGRLGGQFGGRIGRFLGFKPSIRTSGKSRKRGPLTHVIIMDGTMSSLDVGHETNAGLTYRLCAEASDGENMLVRYEDGIQWQGWREAMSVIEGRGINRQIRHTYGELASRYRPGDRIFLFGYSRGAFAVRSLAGLIDKLGLVRAERATERNIRTAYRHYQTAPNSDAAQAFSKKNSHAHTPIEFLGVWDTVSAIGVRLPVLWRLSQVTHKFYDLQPAGCVMRAYHALAYDEKRVAYDPVMFHCDPESNQIVQQMWFHGAHADIGGQLRHYGKDRKLSNATLVWMLDKAEGAGLVLPDFWRMRYPLDPHGTAIGMNHGFGWLFMRRHRREVGKDPSEIVHPSIYVD